MYSRKRTLGISATDMVLPGFVPASSDVVAAYAAFGVVPIPQTVVDIQNGFANAPWNNGTGAGDTWSDFIARLQVNYGAPKGPLPTDPTIAFLAGGGGLSTPVKLLLGAAALYFLSTRFGRRQL